MRQRNVTMLWVLPAFTLAATPALAAQQTAPARPSPSPAAAPALAPGDAPRLKLLSPGKPPLQALRYRATVGQAGTVTMTMKSDMTMTMGGTALPRTPTPEMRCGFDYTVTAAPAGGDIRFEFEFQQCEPLEAGDVAPAVMANMRAALAAFKGIKGFAVVSSRGVNREADIVVPPDAPPPVKMMADSMRQSVRQFSAPLPEEPVGVGARWETAYSIKQNGMVIEQTGLNELATLDGDRGRLAIKITQSAPPQRIQAPGAPDTVRTELVSLSSTGDGESDFDLTRLAPRSARVALKMAMKMRVAVGEQAAEEMDATMDMTMKLTGADKPPAKP